MSTKTTKKTLESNPSKTTDDKKNGDVQKITSTLSDLTITDSNLSSNKSSDKSTDSDKSTSPSSPTLSPSSPSSSPSSDEYNDRPTFYFHDLKENPIRAGGVIFYKKLDDTCKLLMIKSRGAYEDFGGRTDKDDSGIEETVAREVDEESNGIFKRQWVKEQIDEQEPVYTSRSKYVIYFVELEKDYDVKIFGDREIHDDIERTVEWIDYDKFLNQDFIKKNLCYRLKHRKFFDRLTNLSMSLTLE